jgi:hypothetical protein
MATLFSIRDTDSDARRAAKALLERRFRYVDSVGEETRPREISVAEMLMEQRYLTHFLFEVTAPDEPSREQLFGCGRGGIRADFTRLKSAIFELALTGRANEGPLRDGEKILDALIQGVAKEEEDAKRGINPVEAAEQVTLERLACKVLGGAKVSPGPITPDEIDAAQVNSLLLYQHRRSYREALEEIRSAVQQINRELETEDPGWPPETPSR